jgi:hypothetical protein
MKRDYQMRAAKDAKYTSRVDSRIVLYVGLDCRLTPVDAFLALIVPLFVSDSHRFPLRNLRYVQRITDHVTLRTNRARLDILQTDSTSP